VHTGGRRQGARRRRVRELHLFAGIGGGILGGMLLGHRCVGAVEIDPYCRRVLEARQRDGILEPFPIHDDIKTFDGTAWRGRVDVVCGGFPCQPWSSAGKRLGAADPRHLWPEMARVVAECRPAYVFAENVSMAAFEEPWRDLRGLGYRVPPALCLGAVDVGAPHRRNRWWLLAADANCERGRGQKEPLKNLVSDVRWTPQLRHWKGEAEPAMANSDRKGLEERQGERGDARAQQPTAVGGRWWATEPRVGRVAHGVPARVDRLRSLGNAQVPAVAAAAFRELMVRLP